MRGMNTAAADTRTSINAAVNPVKQPELGPTTSERQLARLIGFAMGGSFILIVVLYSLVL